MGISKDRDQRMQVCILTVFDLMVILMLQDIGQFIAQQDYDIVFLQVWLFKIMLKGTLTIEKMFEKSQNPPSLPVTFSTVHFFCVGVLS